MKEGTHKSIPFPANHNYSSSTGSTDVGTSKRNSSSTLLDSHRCRKRFRLMQDAFRSLSFGDSTARDTWDAGAPNAPSGTTALKDTDPNGLARKNATSSIYISNTKLHGSTDQITYLDPNRDGHTIFDLEDDDDSFLEEEEGEEGSTAICNNLNSIEPRISASSNTITTPWPGDYKDTKKSYDGLLPTEDDEDDSVGSKASQEQSTQPATILPPILQKERRQTFLSAVDTIIEDLIRQSRLQASLHHQQQQQQQQPQRHKLLNHQGELVSTFSQDDFHLLSSLPPPLRFLPRQRSNSFSDYSNTNDAEEMMILD